MTMKNRAEVAALVNRQMKDSPDISEGYRNGKTLVQGLAKGEAHHYGKQELRELLDFIYGGPPTDDHERIV